MDHCWKNCSRNCNRPASQLNPKNSFFVPKSFPFNLPLSLSLSLSLAWNPPTVGRLHNLRNCQESVFRRLLTSPPPSLSSLERLQFKFLMREPCRPIFANVCLVALSTLLCSCRLKLDAVVRLLLLSSRLLSFPPSPSASHVCH